MTESSRPKPIPRKKARPVSAPVFQMPSERPDLRAFALRNKPQLVTIGIIAAVSIGVTIVIYTLGAGHGLRVATDAIAETKQAQNLAEIYKGSAADWKLQAEEASSTIKTLESKLASATAAAELYRGRAEEASSTIATLKQQKATKTTPAAAPTQVSRTSSFTPAEGGHGGVWPESKTAGVLAAAADYYGMTGADREFIVAKGCYIVYRGAENRGGICDKWNTSGSGARGLFQYMPSWGTGPCPHGASDWRACGTCSCYAFGKVYKDAGVAGLKRQWAATYGG